MQRRQIAAAIRSADRQQLTSCDPSQAPSDSTGILNESCHVHAQNWLIPTTSPTSAAV